MDTWLSEQAKVNCLVFDKDRKEFLLITNGKCVLNHKDPEGYAKDHPTGSCKLRPFEAIALRVIGHNKGRPIYGWAYIEVPEGANLEPAPQNLEWFMRALRARVSKYNLGRL